MEIVTRKHIISFTILTLAFFVGLAGVSTDYKTFVPKEEQVCFY